MQDALSRSLNLKQPVLELGVSNIYQQAQSSTGISRSWMKSVMNSNTFTRVSHQYVKNSRV